MTTTDDKRRVRAEVRTTLARLAPSDTASWSRAICERLASSAPYRSARVILAFIPIPGEPDITALLDQARADGKGLALPRIDWNSRTLTPAEAPPRDALVPSRHGILEPPASAAVVPLGDLDLILVPLLAFTDSGHRLGRGAGFYDRFLASPAIRAPRIAPAFEAQRLETLPLDPWDIPLHAIATERRWIQV